MSFPIHALFRMHPLNIFGLKFSDPVLFESLSHRECLHTRMKLRYYDRLLEFFLYKTITEIEVAFRSLNELGLP